MGLLLLSHVLLLRETTCRVETKDHAPCRWRVRGLMTGCNQWHLGMKRGLPQLRRSAQNWTLPELIWLITNEGVVAA